MNSDIDETCSCGFAHPKLPDEELFGEVLDSCKRTEECDVCITSVKITLLAVDNGRSTVQVALYAGSCKILEETKILDRGDSITIC